MNTSRSAFPTPSSMVPEVDVIADLHRSAREDPYAQLSAAERLLLAVEAHITAEAETLPTYQRVATASGDPVIDLVMRLILEDEVHHHGLLRRISASLHDALAWDHSAESLPVGHLSNPPAVTPGLVAEVQALVQEEHDGAKTLRHLAHDQRNLADGLISLLLEAMAHDSEKHAKLLTFVQQRLASRADPA